MIMNALQPHRYPSPNSQPSRPPRVRHRVQQRQSSQQPIVLEATVKLTVNCVLALTAIVTLVKLIPYNQAQVADLERLEAEVQEASTKVATLETDFDRHFDPQQALNVMQEQNIRFNPKQRQIVWLQPDTKKAEQPGATGQQQANATGASPD